MRVYALQGFVFQPVVAVEEEDVVAPGVVEACVAGGAEAAVGLGDDAEAAVARGIFGQYSSAAVGRAVVDTYGLPVAAGLCQHAVETFVQVELYIVDGYDDGEVHRALIGLDNVDSVQLQGGAVAPHGAAVGGDGGEEACLAADVDGVAVVGTMRVGEMSDRFLQQFLQPLP